MWRHNSEKVLLWSDYRGGNWGWERLICLDCKSQSLSVTSCLLYRCLFLPMEWWRMGTLREASPDLLGSSCVIDHAGFAIGWVWTYRVREFSLHCCSAQFLIDTGLENLLQEVLQNAVNYSPKGQSIQIEIELDEESTGWVLFCPYHRWAGGLEHDFFRAHVLTGNMRVSTWWPLWSEH